MKSKANIKGHPLHPILVSFPIAFFIGAFISDLLFILIHNPAYEMLGRYAVAAGILASVIAAIPGIIDYYYTVPPESSAKKRAGTHGFINVTMLLIFIFSLLLRRNADVNFLVILSLEGAGIILMTIAGWMGGTLVVRNQIGIDHRYTSAGKWKELHGEIRSGKVEVKDLDKLKEGQMLLLHVEGKRIVIGKTESGYAAFDDRCTHRGASLADGVLICETVQCPWHGSQFNVKNGNVVSGPAEESIKTYGMEINNDSAYILIESHSKE
jgi:uncharacterized membrane protein/nitrite reductase/ring-hydroxylating ferredoxin subunit